MAPFDANHAVEALQLLAEAAPERQVEFEQYSSQQQTDSEDDVSAEGPLFDAFLETDRSAAIHQMTNFSADEFHLIWNRIHNFVSDKWNVGRGRKASVTGKDAFFITLTVMKHGGTWDFLARMFDMKGPTFERLVTKFIQLIAKQCYEELVVNVADRYPMELCLKQRRVFRYHPSARYATNVTFQQANRPSGNVKKSRKYYSGKHKLYWYKVEVSVTPFRMAMLFSNHHPGSVADVDIFYKMLPEHRVLLEKGEKEVDVLDNGLLTNEFPNQWATIMDKGYQGAAEFVRAIIPVKKPRNGYLTKQEESDNRNKASDRIIVENYFGRLCMLWTLFASCYRWDEGLYDDFFKFGLAMTNEHVCCHPLRDTDRKFYQKYCNRNESIGREVAEKRRLKQQKYREKRRRRLNVQFKTVVSSDEETQKP